MQVKVVLLPVQMCRDMCTVLMILNRNTAHVVIFCKNYKNMEIISLVDNLSRFHFVRDSRFLTKIADSIL